MYYPIGYVCIVAAVACLWCWVRYQERSPESSKPLNGYEAALLKGGYKRLAEATVANLLHKQVIRFRSRKRLEASRGAKSSDSFFELVVLEVATAGGTLEDVRQSMKRNADVLESQLVDAGLLRDSAHYWILRGVGVWLFGGWALLGVWRLSHGIPVSRIERWTVLVILLSVIGGFLCAKFGFRLTRAGSAALRREVVARPSVVTRRAEDQAMVDSGLWGYGLHGLAGVQAETAEPMRSAIQEESRDNNSGAFGCGGSGASSSDSGNSGCGASGCGSSGCGGGGCGGG